jgi:YfiH family protein
VSTLRRAVEERRVGSLQGFSCPGFGDAAGVRHVFGARAADGSGNLALSGDRDREAACAARAAWIGSLGGDAARLVVGGQVHGATVATVDEAEAGRGASDPERVLPATDGLFTTTRGLPLYVAGADCGTVLLSAGRGDHAALAVVHAGWRGLAGGILGVALARFAAAGHDAASLEAWVAPCIHAPSYEVGPEVAEQAPSGVKHRGQGDRWQLDVEAWCAHELAAGGMRPESIRVSGLDTGSDPRLFSHRRQGEGAGRNGLIALLAP